MFQVGIPFALQQEKHGAEEITGYLSQQALGVHRNSASQVASHTLLGALRPSDILGRWTESEYLIIAAECGQNEALHVADRLCRTVRGADAEWWGDHLKISVSAGAAAVTQGDDSATAGQPPGKANHHE